MELHARNLDSINFVSERPCDKNPTFFKIIGVKMSGRIVTFMAYWHLNMAVLLTKVNKYIENKDRPFIQIKTKTENDEHTIVLYGVLVIFCFQKYIEFRVLRRIGLQF